VRVSVTLRRLAWATLGTNVLLVVTGGAVRLTGSGLGCPTWPRCDEHSFTPHGANGIHQQIEFGNRSLTFILVAVAVATYVAARESGRRDLIRLSVLLALAIPAQAILGGITVLTELNPWVVSLHLLISLGIVSVAVLLLHRLDHPAVPPATGMVPALAWTTYAVTWLVLYAGTVVTGSGPHAGDAKAPRNGLDPLQVSQFHADLVFLLIGLSAGLWFALRAAGADTRPATAMVALEAVQAAIGFVQYFAGLPVAVVMLHMLGAALVAAVATWLLFTVRESAGSAGGGGVSTTAGLHPRGQANRRTE
jgi:cytochrome c oxidase assembly protein subunit 15